MIKMLSDFQFTQENGWYLVDLIDRKLTLREDGNKILFCCELKDKKIPMELRVRSFSLFKTAAKNYLKDLYKRNKV